MLKIKFDPDDLVQLVVAYWPNQSDRMREIENDLETRSHRIRLMQFMKKDDFIRACSWTAIRAKHLYESNEEETIRKTSLRAFTSITDQERIEILTELKGVEFATASALLHMFHSDIYPMMTVPALWSLGADKEPISIELWQSCTYYFRQLVNDWKVSPRNLDRALWQYHYENGAR